MNLDDRLRSAGSRLGDQAPGPTAEGLEDVVRRAEASRRRRVAATSIAASVLAVALAFGLTRAAVDHRIDVAAEGGGRSVTTPGPSRPDLPPGTDPDTTTPGTHAACEIEDLRVRLAGLDRSTAIDRYACRDGWATTLARLGGGGWEISLFVEQNGTWAFVTDDPAAAIDTLPQGPAPVADLFVAMGVPLPTTPAPPAETAGPPTTEGTPAGGERPGVAGDDDPAAPAVTIVDGDPTTDPPPEAIGAAAGALIDAVDPVNRPTEVGDRIVVQDGFFLTRSTVRRFTDAERDALSRALTDRGLQVTFADPTLPDDDPASGLVLGSAALGSDPWSATGAPPPGGYVVRGELSYPDPDGDHFFGGQGSVVRLTPSPTGWLAEAQLAWIT